jgi:hypothetical protein
MKKTKKYVPPQFVERKTPFNDKENLARLDDVHIQLGNDPTWDAAYDFLTTNKCNYLFLMYLSESEYALTIYQALLAYISHLKSFVEHDHMIWHLHEVRARVISSLYSFTTANSFISHCIELNGLNPLWMDRDIEIIMAVTEVNRWTTPLMEHLEIMLCASDSELLTWIDSLDVWEDYNDECYRYNFYLPPKLKPLK